VGFLRVEKGREEGKNGRSQFKIYNTILEYEGCFGSIVYAFVRRGDSFKLHSRYHTMILKIFFGQSVVHAT